MWKFLKRIFRYFFPPKRFFTPTIKEDKFKANEVEYIGSKPAFFEPVTHQEMFEESKSLKDFFTRIDKIS